MLDFLKRYIASFKALKTRSLPVKVEARPDALYVQQGAEEKLNAAWNSITEIVCYKRDLYTVDQLCMLVRIDDKMIELNEQMEGWSELCSTLHELLPGSISFTDWFMYVGFPAFETKALTIYKKGETLHMP